MSLSRIAVFADFFLAIKELPIVFLNLRQPLDFQIKVDKVQNKVGRPRLYIDDTIYKSKCIFVLDVVNRGSK